MATAKTIVGCGTEIRTAFEQWLAVECKVGVCLVVLEGYLGSGKTTLTEQPFSLEAGPSINIELDKYLPREVPETTLYVAAIDQAALDLAIATAVASSTVIILEGAVAWPFVEAQARALGKQHVRRVYLKRMMRLKPDYWQDEDLLFDPEFPPPPTAFTRSIHRYHVEEQPWQSADLILERTEDSNVEGS